MTAICAIFRKLQDSLSLSIQVCPKISGLTRQSCCGDGIGTIKPTLGKGMDPEGFDTKKYQNISKLYTVYRKPRLFFIPKNQENQATYRKLGGPGKKFMRILYIYKIHIYNITQRICLDCNPLNSLELSFSMVFFFRLLSGAQGSSPSR